MVLYCAFRSIGAQISSLFLHNIQSGRDTQDSDCLSNTQKERAGILGPMTDRGNLPSSKMSANHASRRKVKSPRRLKLRLCFPIETEATVCKEPACQDGRPWVQKPGHCKCCMLAEIKQRKAAKEDTLFIRGKSYSIGDEDFEMVPTNDANFKNSPAKRVVHKESNTPMLLSRIPYATPLSADIFNRKLNVYNDTMTHSPFPLHVVGMARASEEEVLVLMGDADFSLQGFITRAHTELGGVPENVGKKIIHSIILGLKELPGDTSLISNERDFLNITPANMYLSLVTGELRCDFGIYRLLRNDNTRALYDIGEEYEYLYYMPERVNPASAGKDTWTWKRLSWVLALILIEIVTGTHPCSHYQTPFEKLKAIVREDPENHIPKSVSPQMVHFLRLCLKKQPLERPTNAQLLRVPFFRGFDPKSVDLTAFIMGSPSSLMHNCRATIHRHFGSQRVQKEDCIDKLPLPQKIKDYLMAIV